VPADHIMENWSPAFFQLMCESMIARKGREEKALAKAQADAAKKQKHGKGR